MLHPPWCTSLATALDIADCRGQSYDNASAMSGVYNGLQAKVGSLGSIMLYEL